MPVPDVSSLLRTLAQKADPAHSALLVIDVQNDFVADGGFFDKVGGDVRTIQQQRVPNLLRLIDAARQAGVLVIFVQAIYDPGDLSDAMRERNLRLNSELPRCLSGSWGAEFYRVRAVARRTRDREASLQRDGRHRPAGVAEGAGHPQPVVVRCRHRYLCGVPPGAMPISGTIT